MGTVASVVARNVADLRDRRRLSVRALSARLSELGHPILASGLSKIENGDRRVDADDLVALAVALGVSPVRLLLPAEEVGEVQLTPEQHAAWSSAWEWATGAQPLPEAHGEAGDPEQFERENQPHRARARSREILRWDEQLGPLREALRQVADDGGVPAAVIRGYVDFWASMQTAARPTIEGLRAAAQDEGDDDGR